MSCAEAQAAIQRHFTGEAPPEAYEQVRAHVESCAACRDLYERLARVDSSLEPGGLSPQRLDALEGRLFAKLGVSAAAPAPVAKPWWPKASVAALLVAAAAVVLWVGVPRWRASGGDEFQPRGGTGSTFGVRAFCVGAGAQVTAEARPGQVLTCGAGSMVQFTYTAPRTSQLSIEIEGKGLTFFPTSGPRQAIAVGTDIALSSSTPVGDWLTGSTPVVARFTDADGKPLAESRLTIAPPPGN
jgi:hypothetical protein